MKIDQIRIENFRLLKDCTLDMSDKTTLLVGKNNTGKTSFAVLLEKFLSKATEFNYADFPLSARAEILNISDSTDVDAISIRLVLKVAYTDTDDLGALSEFMLDLDASRRHVNILLECRIHKGKLLDKLPIETRERKKFIESNMGRQFLETKCYAFDDTDHEGPLPYYRTNRDQLEEKEMKDLTEILNFQVIHARRNVASSEDAGRGAKSLSTISTKFFQRNERDAVAGKSDDPEKGDNKDRAIFDELRRKLTEIDAQLEKQYDKVFDGFLKSSRDFLGLGELKVVSNVQSQSLIETASQVIYGKADNFLPENHSGLGYLNILYLLLQIELCRDEFARQSAPLNLLIIEEPEAHTHPQMQYVFADKIRGLISEITNLQAIITTHSSHIISKSDFEDIRYLFKSAASDDIIIKNFHTDLRANYDALDQGQELFKFLKQYLTIHSAELFFASMVIFIEGTTERILLPWFIDEHDRAVDSAPSSGGLSSQNITVLEVGANAKAFAPFLEFIGVKTLIITDIDTTKYKKDDAQERGTYNAHPVEGSTHTSNESLKYFFSAPHISDEDNFRRWHQRLVQGELESSNELFKISYQTKQNGYHPRSFEDAFLSLNLDKIIEHKDALRGLKNIQELTLGNIDYYKLTNRILDKKSDFSASILYMILAKEEKWEIPQYIKDGLVWLHKS